eukprot:scpid32721/ scgid15455/ 
MSESLAQKPRRRFAALFCTGKGTRRVQHAQPEPSGGTQRKFVCAKVSRRRVPRKPTARQVEVVPGEEYSLDCGEDDCNATRVETSAAAITPALSLLLGSGGGGGGRRMSAVTARASVLSHQSMKYRLAGNCWRTSGLGSGSSPMSVWPQPALPCPRYGSSHGNASVALLDMSQCMQQQRRHLSTQVKAATPSAGQSPRRPQRARTTTSPYQFDDIVLPATTASIPMSRPPREQQPRSHSQITSQAKDAVATGGQRHQGQFALASLDTSAHTVYGSGLTPVMVPESKQVQDADPYRRDPRRKMDALLFSAQESLSGVRVDNAVSVLMAPSPRSMQRQFTSPKAAAVALPHVHMVTASGGHTVDGCGAASAQVVVRDHSTSTAEFLLSRCRRQWRTTPASAGHVQLMPVTCTLLPGRSTAPTSSSVSSTTVMPCRGHDVPLYSLAARPWGWKRIFLQRLIASARLYQPSVSSRQVPGLLFDTNIDLQRFRQLESYALLSLAAAAELSPRIRGQWLALVDLPLNEPLLVSSECLAARLAMAMTGILREASLFEAPIPASTGRALTQALLRCVTAAADDTASSVRTVLLRKCASSSGLRWARSPKPSAPVEVIHGVSQQSDCRNSINILPVTRQKEHSPHKLSAQEPADMFDFHCYPELFALLPVVHSMKQQSSLLASGVERFASCTIADDGCICLQETGSDVDCSVPHMHPPGHFLFVAVPQMSDEVDLSSLTAVMEQFYSCLGMAKHAGLHRVVYRLLTKQPGNPVSTCADNTNEIHCLLLWIAASVQDLQLVVLCPDEEDTQRLARIGRMSRSKRVSVRELTSIIVSTFGENQYAALLPRVLAKLERRALA